MKVSSDLLVDLQLIDDTRVYEVSCVDSSHRKYKLAIFADNYLEFKNMLDQYLEDEPTARIDKIVPLTVDQYKAAHW